MGGVTTPGRCGGCPASWTGERITHCAGCHQTFNTLGAFDKHRLRYSCQEPASRGLVLNDRGRWGYPPPDS